ncbi:MAG: hypothetical protein A2W26_05470 [Acidobacteria bacterium RBG_16_64_8]|nr:MAG: hypothetical protein A2W26_05470 [Acidobacteria bacterium RBG_16_64_8]
MKILVVVPVFNEESLLPHFLRHYLRWADRIVVLDNGSTDRTVEVARRHPDVEVRTFQTDGYDELSVLRNLEEVGREARGRYDWVAYPDADEFIISTPSGRERPYLEGSRSQVVQARGFCLVHAPGEPALDLSIDLLSQRKSGYPSEAYSKPVFIRPEAGARFLPGKHGIRPDPPCLVEDPGSIHLIHAEMIDWDLWVYRKNRRALSRANIENGYSTKRFCRPREDHERIWKEALARPRSPVPGGEVAHE